MFKPESKPSSKRQDFAMILGAFKRWAQGFILGDNEQAHRAESTKSAQKPTPKLES